jgi:hypothetical protein
VNDAQTWTLIAGFLGALLLLGTMVLRTVESRIEALDGRMIGKFERLDANIDGLDSRLTAQIETLHVRLSGRIDQLEVKLTGRIDSLDRDVRVLTEKIFRKGPGS